jgi:ankyrin repeat protein
MSLNILALLTSCIRDQTQTELEHICRTTGKVHRLDILLMRNRNIDVNLVKFDGGWSPLHLCCLYGHTACAELLIDRYHADLRITRDEDGATPLHVASSSGSRSIAMLLIARDIQLVHDRSLLGFTALHYSCLADKLDIYTFLINKGADVRSRSRVSLSVYYRQRYITCRLLDLFITSSSNYPFSYPM